MANCNTAEASEGPFMRTRAAGTVLASPVYKKVANNQLKEIMKKIKNLGAVVLLASATIAGMCCVSGCAGDRYHESTGESIDDTGTTARVKEALHNSAYNYPDVKVTTFKGTVQLSGFVDNSEQKRQAADLARNVAGVKEVDNNISVKPSS